VAEVRPKVEAKGAGKEEVLVVEAHLSRKGVQRLALPLQVEGLMGASAEVLTILGEEWREAEVQILQCCALQLGEVPCGPPS